jgi:predicted XRE-type DNA-binding protein
MSSTRLRKKHTKDRVRQGVSSSSSSDGSGLRDGTRKVVEVYAGTGNVFADMGLAKAGELLFKTDLAIAIGRVITGRRLSQARAADLIGIDQPKVSALMKGDTRGFSVDRLLRILTRLGHDVEIRVRCAKGARGRIRVAA